MCGRIFIRLRSHSGFTNRVPEDFDLKLPKRQDNGFGNTTFSVMAQKLKRENKIKNLV